jgi:hypothetical protein
LRALFVIISLCSLPAVAQEQRLQAWFLGMAQARVHGDGLVYIEFQPRGTLLPSSAAKVDQVLLRAAVGWQLHRAFSLWVGAAYINGEQRVFEQLFWGENFGPVRLSVRARLEQRWLPDTEGVRHRARVMFRAAWTFKDPFLLIVYDEPFVNLQGSLFDQNRAYVALGYRPHPKVLVEVGYLNQLFATRMGHTPILTVGIGF